MAAHAGIVYTDGHPVPESATAALSQFNGTRGPDSRGAYVSDGVACLSFGLHFDALSAAERQPVHAPDGALVTWDGRLDNRDDLNIALGPDAPADRSDAAIIAAALTKWGVDALAQAVGEWSIARWDPARRELLLALDYTGARPLHYYVGSNYVAWSTLIEPLVDLCQLSGDVSDEFMVRFLTHQTLRDHTPYRGLRLVPPGSCLRIRSDLVVQHQSFTEFSPRTVRYRDPRDYGAHYRQELTTAVRARLRARRTVWTELSGGHDSSSITCIANRLVASGAVDAPALQPVSYVLPGSPESDESEFIGAVERFCGLSGVRLSAGREGSSTDALAAAPSDSPESIDAVVVRAGSHVLLSGELGDLVSAGASVDDALLDHLLSFRWRQFLADNLAVCRFERRPLWTAWPSVLRLLMPASRLERRLAAGQTSGLATARRVRAGDTAGLFALNADFVSRTRLQQSSIADLLDRMPRPRRQYCLRLHNFFAIGALTGRVGHLPLTIAYPFTHRPLIDLILGMPASVLWRPEHGRAFACAALRDVLPSAVTTREGKGNPTAHQVRQLTPTLLANMDALPTWQLVSRGYVDASALAKLFHSVLDGSQPTSTLVDRLVGAELLIRRLCRAPIDALRPELPKRQHRFNSGSLAATPAVLLTPQQEGGDTP